MWGMLEPTLPDDRDNLLFPEETAARLRIKERTLLENVRRRKIPVVKINARTFRFHWPSVLAALQKVGAR
jgi:hypothetical protein